MQFSFHCNIFQFFTWLRPSPFIYRVCHRIWLTFLEPILLNFFYKYFFGVPHLATCIFLVFCNELELGAEIDPGMALTPLPSSIGRGSNPRHSDCKTSARPQLSLILLNFAFTHVTNFRF